MGKIFLCGYTGSENRGCDAIARSTVGILRTLGEQDIKLMTFAQQQDKALGLDEVVELMAYPKKTPLMRAASGFARKVLGNGVWGHKCLYDGLLSRAKDGDMVFNIGGDTYCYGKPYISYALNEVTQRNGIPNIFWGCSVDERLLKDPQMQQDVNRYEHIVAREALSYDILRSCVENKDKVHLACDPAFMLEAVRTELPDGFVPGNTLGINVSPLVFKDADDGNDMMYRNIYCLIDFVLANSDMHICLIPHVYNIALNTQDIKIMRRIREKYAQEPRVSVVERELNSQQLKYIICQCRFFMGARTHSMIAAYSGQVPALALSYSSKSLGIARDLFGAADPYAIPWRNITRPEQLRDAFIQVLQEKESWMRERYRELIPEYRTQILEVTKHILKKN